MGISCCRGLGWHLLAAQEGSASQEAEPEQAFSRTRQPVPGTETHFLSRAGWAGAQGMTFSVWHVPM